MMGEFMKYLPITLIVSLGSSLFVALVVNPALLTIFMKVDQGEAVGGQEANLILVRKEVGARDREPVIRLDTLADILEAQTPSQEVDPLRRLKHETTRSQHDRVRLNTPHV